MLRPAAIIAATTLSLGACGGAQAPARFDDGIVEIRIDDYRHHPERVEVPRGRVTFRVTNGGRLAHNFGVRSDRGVRLQISTMLPGESDEGAVRLRPGTYRMYCAAGNHEELGEYGLVIVR